MLVPDDEYETEEYIFDGCDAEEEDKQASAKTFVLGLVITYQTDWTSFVGHRTGGKKNCEDLLKDIDGAIVEMLGSRSEEQTTAYLAFLEFAAVEWSAMEPWVRNLCGCVMTQDSQLIDWQLVFRNGIKPFRYLDCADGIPMPLLTGFLIERLVPAFRDKTVQWDEHTLGIYHKLLQQMHDTITCVKTLAGIDNCMNGSAATSKLPKEVFKCVQQLDDVKEQAVVIRSFLTYILRAKLSVESLKNMMNRNLRQLLGNLIKTNCTGTLRVRVYKEIEALAIKKRTVKQPGVMHKWNFHYRDTDGVGEYYTPARSGAISLCAVRRCLNQASSYVTEVDSYSKDNGALRQDSIAVMRDGSMTSTIAGTVASVHSQLLQTPFGSLQWQQLHRNGIDDPTAAPIDYCTLNRVGANPTINAVLNQIQHAMTASTYVHHAVFINHYEQQAITLQAAAEYESMGYVAEYRSLYHSTTDWSTVESILFTGLKRSAEPEVNFQPAGYVRSSTGTLFDGGVYTCEGFHQGFGPNSVIPGSAPTTVCITRPNSKSV